MPSSFMGILKVKFMFFMLFFTYSRYFKRPWRVCHGLMTHPLVVYRFISKTNHMQLICCLHAARYAERGGDSRQDADGYLNHHFPGFLFHHLLVF